MIRKKIIYLIVSVKSRSVVGWAKQQSERDGMLTELNRSTPGQYIAATMKVENDRGHYSCEFDPADIVVPEIYHRELERTARGY